MPRQPFTGRFAEGFETNPGEGEAFQHLRWNRYAQLTLYRMLCKGD